MIVATWTHDKAPHRLVRVEIGMGHTRFVMERMGHDAAGGERWTQVLFNGTWGDRPTPNEAALIDAVRELAAALAQARSTRMG